LQLKAPAYKSYLIVVLAVVYAFSIMDRLTLSLVQQNIKVDLNLTDTQLGCLSGIAFGLFYAAVGIPIARWADRGNRVLIIAITTALWSAAVILCGVAGNFVQLLLIRIGAAVGEAGCVPPAQSLIADSFARPDRPRAYSRYMLASPLGVVIGYFVAGWLNQIYGWRVTFITLGVPGVVLAALAVTTLREPRTAKIPALTMAGQGLQHDDTAESSDGQQLIDVSKTLWRNRTFRYLLCGYSVCAFSNYGILQWQPAFFVRSFGLRTGELGIWLTMVGGFCALVGTYLGGEVSTRYAANNERRQLKALAVAYCAYGAISICAFLSRNYVVAFVLMGIAALVCTTVMGVFWAVIQTLVPPRMRAMAVGIVFLFYNLIGGMGSVAAGVLSDALQPFAGNESLRYALVALWPGYFWGAWYFWRATKTVNDDLKHVEADAVLPSKGPAKATLLPKIV
jgi:MFS transporter, Spinster family, sphingosine-1-phosphate transporter